jgi:riboflavin biosynthesis pyrimidine reductase
MQESAVEAIYADLDFLVHNVPQWRPYTFINMVATIDGKVVSGARGEPVTDLGSEVDHLLMRRIEAAADAVLIGAESQRSSSGIWYPPGLKRIVATVSGNVLAESRFFTDEPHNAWVFCTMQSVLPRLPAGVSVVRFPGERIDWRGAARHIREGMGVERLLVEGGSSLNGQILGADLVDELFLTVAPKVKLGDDVPTYAGGEPLPRERLQRYSLLEAHRVGDELFLRYRRVWH